MLVAQNDPRLEFEQLCPLVLRLLMLRRLLPQDRDYYTSTAMLLNTVATQGQLLGLVVGFELD